MSVSIDTNLLLYAVNSDAPEHEAALKTLKALTAGDETVYLAWPVILAFLRISTHPAILAQPLAFSAARRYIDNLLALPTVQAIGEGPEFWRTLVETAVPLQPSGNFITDVHIAAILRDNGVRTFYTNDADFRRFSFLRIVNPLLA